MRRTTLELIGREDELGAIVHVLDAFEELPATALLHGEAGIGKTTIWRAGIDAAVERGYRVLRSRPSEAETRFSYAGLGDLLGGVADEVLPELPPIQRRSLEAALLLGDTDGGTDERAVAAAFLAALRLLAAETPLCVAVDDIQWLDEASVSALRFASSRLADTRVAALHAVRGDPPTWLRRGDTDARPVPIEIAGLSIGATHELLGSRLGVSFPRPTLVRLWEAAGGNPFFALELADALRRRGGTLELGEELPVPSSLADLLGERLWARLVAEGRTNREVAAALFLTVHSVETSLTRVYRKLGVRSRAELTRLRAEGD